MAKKRQTLGNNVIPVNYTLEFRPNLKTFRYWCKETISIRINKQARSLRLNSVGLSIKKAVISSGRHVQNAKVKEDKKLQQITLSFKEEINGKAELTIEFEGTNDDSLRGLYRSKYFDNGKEQYILTSQFEPSDARKAFPCFDEPAFKATFDISFRIPKGLSAVSNMPIKTERAVGNGEKIVTFIRTPIMSSYLLYLGVGKFEFTTTKPKGLPKLSVVTVPGRSDKTRMALSMCEKFLRFYNDYFGIKYPLPKLDLLAIPDFSASAMENWGAITFREIALLGDEKSSSVMVMQRIAEVIAHELTHQWFGDLVTMEWWDDLWLNESFATFMAAKAVEAAFPKWGFELQNHVENIEDAFAIDQYVSTHPINAEVSSPGQINEIFDEISYDKGGCVLGMLEDYSGKTAFRNGLHNYLKKHSYSNATKEDLWGSVGEAAKKGIRVANVARDWINKKGYPMISVSHDSKGKLLMKQKRFLMLKTSKLNDVWPIPIHYSVDNKKDSFILMNKGNLELRVKDPRSIRLNCGQRGLYRTDYQADMLEGIGKDIKNGRLNSIDSWGVERDMYALMRSSRIKVTQYLDFVEKYCLNAKYPLDLSISGHLSGLMILLSDNAVLSKKVKRLSMRYHKRILGRLGWEGPKDERNVTKMLRSVTIASLGICGYAPVIAKARSMFASYAEKGKQINKDLRSAVYHINAWNGNLNTYNRLVRLFKKETNPENQRRLLQAIGQFNNEAIVLRALEFSLSKYVRLQDSIILAVFAAGSQTGKKVFWKWLKSHWKHFMKRYAPGAHMLETYVGCMGIMGDSKTRRSIKEFYSKSSNMRGDIRMEVSRTLERIDINVKFGEYNS